MSWGDGECSWRGGEGGAAARPLPGRATGAFFTPPPPPPGAPSLITIAVHISKAAPGLFRSGNLILRGVYFSTLENSQCRTQAAAASGQRGCGTRVWGAGRGGGWGSAHTRDPHGGPPVPRMPVGLCPRSPVRGPRVCAHSGGCCLTLGSPQSLSSPAGPTIVREGRPFGTQNCVSKHSTGEAEPEGASFPP